VHVLVGVDYAWHGDLDPKVFENAGYGFIARYLSHDPTKDLSAAEAVAFSKEGLSLVVVWETTTSRALEGFNAGVQDAKEAFARAKDLGMPADRPVYFAVDMDASGPQVEQYFKGVLSVTHDIFRIGVYGGYDVVSWLFNAGYVAYGWQTFAWSEGKVDIRAQMQQGKVVNVQGIDCDWDKGTGEDFGQWKSGEHTAFRTNKEKAQASAAAKRAEFTAATAATAAAAKPAPAVTPTAAATASSNTAAISSPSNMAASASRMKAVLQMEQRHSGVSRSTGVDPVTPGSDGKPAPA
jgi:hypothetical protein